MVQSKHEKAVASRSVGSAAAWALPHEVLTMQIKRFLIPVVAALGLTLCAMPSIANAGAGMTGANDLASQGKSNVTLVRGFGGGFPRRRLSWRRFPWRRIWRRPFRGCWCRQRLLWRRLGRTRLGRTRRGLAWRRLGLAQRLGWRLGLARWRRPRRSRSWIGIPRLGLWLGHSRIQLWRLRLVT